MSVNITTAFTKQYSDNILSLVQQRASRLRNACMVETGKRGEEVYMERIGSVTAQKVTSRHEDSPQIDTPHSRRRVTPVSYDWGDMIDDVDRVRMLIDPTSVYAQNAASAMGRAIDNEILDALSGTASTGADGSGSASLSNTVAIGSATYGNSSGDCGLTISKLLEARQKINAGEGDDYDLEGNPNIFVAVNSLQLAHLLSDISFGHKHGGTITITSGAPGTAMGADMGQVRQLASGEISEFMGMRFIRTELLNTDSSDDQLVMMWHREGMGFCVWDDIRARITERADKRFSTYVYFSMTVGAVRLQEEKVCSIACHPA